MSDIWFGSGWGKCLPYHFIEENIDHSNEKRSSGLVGIIGRRMKRFKMEGEKEVSEVIRKNKGRNGWEGNDRSYRGQSPSPVY